MFNRFGNFLVHLNTQLEGDFYNASDSSSDEESEHHSREAHSNRTQGASGSVRSYGEEQRDRTRGHEAPEILTAGTYPTSSSVTGLGIFHEHETPQARPQTAIYRPLQAEENSHPRKSGVPDRHPHSEGNVSSGPVSPPGILPYRMDRTDVETSDEAIQVFQNRQQTYDELEGIIPPTEFTMAAFSRWRTDMVAKSPRRAAVFAGVAGYRTVAAFLDFVPEVRTGYALTKLEKQDLETQGRRPLPPREVRRGTVHYDRTQEEMFGTMRQEEQPAQKPAGRSHQRSRIPIAQPQQRARVQDYQASGAPSIRRERASPPRRPPSRRSRLPRPTRPNRGPHATEGNAYMASSERRRVEQRSPTASRRRVPESRTRGKPISRQGRGRDVPPAGTQPARTQPARTQLVRAQPVQPNRPRIPPNAPAQGRQRVISASDFVSDEVWNAQIC